jgi:hypothetical protein
VSIRGRIAVDVQFADDDASDGAKSLKTITLQDATEYTEGKVAVATGTVGTAGVTFLPSGLAYRDAAGQTVSMTLTRLAMQSPTLCRVSAGALTGWSLNGQPVVANVTASPTTVSLTTTAGTASYTLVLYGT